MLQELVKNYPGVVEYSLIADKSSAMVRFDNAHDSKVALTGNIACINLIQV